MDLDGTKITNGGLKHLKGLTRLKDLDLAHTIVSNAGLKDLKGLAHLEILGLSGTNVTDAGLKYLEDLPQLRWVGLCELTITDAGLGHLENLSQLTALGLRDTKITSNGLRKHWRNENVTSKPSDFGASSPEPRAKATTRLLAAEYLQGSNLALRVDQRPESLNQTWISSSPAIGRDRPTSASRRVRLRRISVRLTAWPNSWLSEVGVASGSTPTVDPVSPQIYKQVKGVSPGNKEAYALEVCTAPKGTVY